MYDQDDVFESEMYYDREPASAAVERLHGLGYRRDDISVMMDDKTREKAFAAVVNAKGRFAWRTLCETYDVTNWPAWRDSERPPRTC